MRIRYHLPCVWQVGYEKKKNPKSRFHVPFVNARGEHDPPILYHMNRLPDDGDGGGCVAATVFFSARQYNAKTSTLANRIQTRRSRRHFCL